MKHIKNIFKFNNNEEKAFYKLIDICLEDKVITEEEMEVLLDKANSIGMNEGEAKIHIESRLNKILQEETRKDVYDISDEELVIRCRKWMNLYHQDNVDVTVEPFPKLLSKKRLKQRIGIVSGVLAVAGVAAVVATGGGALAIGGAAATAGGAVSKLKGASKIASISKLANVSKFSKFSAFKAIGAESILTGISKKIGSNTKESQLTNNEIREIAHAYFAIISFRQVKNDVMAKTYEDFNKVLEPEKECN